MTDQTVPTVPPSAGLPVPAPRRGNAMAITGFVVAVVALVLCFVPIINNFAFGLAFVGLVLGIVGLVKTRKGAAHKGLAVAAVVVAVLAGIGVIASQAVYGAAADAVSESLDEASADLDRMSGGATDEVLTDDVSVEIGDLEAIEDELGMITTSLPVTLTNISDEKQSYDVSVEAVDASGDRIADDFAYVSDLAPGQSETVDVFQLVDDGDLEAMKDATYQVSEASAY